MIKDTQQQAFQDELRLLHDKKALPNTNKLSSLCPFVDATGMLRVGGRLKYATIPYDAKHPYIIPSNHPVTKLIIEDEHRSNGHIGSEHVLANLRECYWIVNGRTAIKGVIRKCFFCIVKRATIMYPYMADLPPARMAYEEPPFSNCGVDLIGPFNIKQGRKQLKRWIVLFTCLTVRCVHLEVVQGIDTDAFINSLRRFVNR